MSDVSTAAAVQIRDALRHDILGGLFLPGARLKEQVLSEKYRVSRNTVRDGIRLLAADGLVTTQRNAGSAVTSLSESDVRDIYAVRRALEIPAVLASATTSSTELRRLRDVCDETLAAANRGEWSAAGTRSLLFHQAIVGLHASERLSTFFENILAQLRLVFFVMNDEPGFQRVWPARDVDIADLIIRGRREEAAALMKQYLNDSEAMIVDALRLNASADQNRRSHT